MFWEMNTFLSLRKRRATLKDNGDYQPETNIPSGLPFQGHDVSCTRKENTEDEVRKSM